MRNVQFSYKSGRPYFSYQNEAGATEYFEYKLPISGDFNVSMLREHEVELLINPVLNKERHHYALCTADEKGHKTSIGVIFPVSLLDGTEEALPKGQYNYFIIAFFILLKRLEKITDTIFSQNFEDNVCVCVFDLQQANSGYRILPKCIHSLRSYNYSYFVENNTYKPVVGYRDEWYIDAQKMNIVVSLQEPQLYKASIIDTLLRVLPSVNNIVHRFFFLYQIIEFIIAGVQKQEIIMEIKKYEEGFIPENDFFDDVLKIKRERGVVREIFKKCDLTEPDCPDFVHDVKSFFALISYKPKNQELYSLFYSFRNQMTHSLRDLLIYDESMAKTIFEFEQVVMQIVAKYPYNN